MTNRIPTTRPVALAAIATGLLIGALTAPAAAQSDPPDPDDIVRRRLLVVDARGERLDDGGSATPFSMELEGEDECPGDSAHDQYRIDSYLVPIDVDPSELRFAAQGPNPPSFRTYEDFRMPLHELASDPYAAELTAKQVEPGGPGPIPEIPALSFEVYVATNGIDDYEGGLPPGEYRMGLACTFGGRITNLWETTIELRQDAADQPVGIAWTVTGPQPTDLESTASGSGADGPVRWLLAVAAAMALVAAGLFSSAKRSGRAVRARAAEGPGGPAPTGVDVGSGGSVP